MLFLKHYTFLLLMETSEYLNRIADIEPLNTRITQLFLSSSENTRKAIIDKMSELIEDIQFSIDNTPLVKDSPTFYVKPMDVLTGEFCSNEKLAFRIAKNTYMSGEITYVAIVTCLNETLYASPTTAQMFDAFHTEQPVDLIQMPVIQAIYQTVNEAYHRKACVKKVRPAWEERANDAYGFAACNKRLPHHPTIDQLERSTKHDDNKLWFQDMR